MDDDLDELERQEEEGEWVEDDREAIIVEAYDGDQQSEDNAEVQAMMSMMAEKAQEEEAEAEAAQMLANDAKFWRDQAAWESTGGLQSSGDANIQQEVNLPSTQSVECANFHLPQAAFVKAATDYGAH